jgi:hypothetical protein
LLAQGCERCGKLLDPAVDYVDEELITEQLLRGCQANPAGSAGNNGDCFVHVTAFTRK